MQSGILCSRPLMRPHPGSAFTDPSPHLQPAPHCAAAQQALQFACPLRGQSPRRSHTRSKT
jgi:hypothetical protein